MSRGWIGVDLDRTLAYYDTWKGADHIGPPVERMLERVKQWIADGFEVRIVTARVQSDGTLERHAETIVAHNAILAWTKEHVGVALKAQSNKDFAMIELWDGRAIQVIPNTGIRVDGNQ